MRHRQHGENTRDRLVFGLPAGCAQPSRAVWHRHTEGVAEFTDARPKKKPAVMSASDAGYAHQIGSANASVVVGAKTNLPTPIIPSDTAKHTAPSAVHGVSSRAGTGHRRSRATGCVSAATANSTAVNGFTAGCSVNWPVSSAPGGTRNAVTMRKAPTIAAAAQRRLVRECAYGVPISVAEEKRAGRKSPDAILLKVLEAVPFQLTTDGGVEASRQRFHDLARRPVHPDVRTEERTIDGPAGPIPIRVYRPPTVGEAALPVVVFLQGGGWSVGDLDTYDGDARNHAVGAGAVVVSVDYRLAPEHPYPAAVEDAWAATQWVAAHAGELGVNPHRLAIAGDSAGGNLTAVVAQLARDAGGPPIRFQLPPSSATVTPSRRCSVLR